MNLVQISDEVRLIIKIIGIGLVVIFLLWLSFISIRALIRAITEPERNLPTVKFGKILPPFLPNYDLSKVLIDIDTPDGSLPSFPNQLNVYPIPEPTGRTNALDIAQQKAASLGVVGTAKALSPTLYQFQDSRILAKSVTIDIVTGHYSFIHDPILDPKALPTSFDKDERTTAESMAKNFFAQGFTGENDFKEGETKSYFIKVAASARNKVSSPSEANAIEVDVFRDKIDKKFEIISPKYPNSLMNALVIPSKSTVRTLQANFVHWLVDFKGGSTYPIKSSNQALAELKDSKAFVVEGKLEGIDRVQINDLKLVYLENENYFPYLEPIYVFSGSSFSGQTKADFRAFVTAVSSEWIKAVE